MHIWCDFQLFLSHQFVSVNLEKVQMVEMESQLAYTLTTMIFLDIFLQKDILHYKINMYSFFLKV